MNESSSVSHFILKPNEICPYKNACDFSKKPSRCYGTVERDKEFVCNLDKLRILYQSDQDRPIDLP